MVDCVTEQRKGAANLYNRPNLNVNAPRAVSLDNMRPTAKSLWDKLRTEEAKIREQLEKLEVTYDLAVELHAPSGTKIRIGDISYYTDTNDTLLVNGLDVSTREQCIVIVPVHSFLVIFRISPVEAGRDPERKPIGFHVYKAEGAE